jgi:hypothetical protein
LMIRLLFRFAFSILNSLRFSVIRKGRSNGSDTTPLWNCEHASSLTRQTTDLPRNREKAKAVGERSCKRCGIIMPHETVTNRQVAKFAQRPGVGTIMPPSIWPDALPPPQAPCGRPPALTCHSTGADWVLRDGTSSRLAENKPWSTVAHWPWATVDDYQRALKDQVITEGPKWRELSPLHEPRHPGRAWEGDCWSCARVKGTGGRFSRLAIPQVVLYCVRTGVPCTLVTDRGQASIVYDVEGYFTINPDWVPVRTIPEVLNSLASSASRPHLSSTDHELLRDVVTRLWWPSPWEALNALSGPANALIKPSARRHWSKCETG